MGVTTEITHSMGRVIDHLVDQIPGVVGALVSSTDGFVLASHLPAESSTDTAGMGAMTSAAIALSNRLVGTVGESPATVCHHRSDDGQVLILPIAHLAVLTILATPDADAAQLTLVGREASAGLQRLFRGAASV